jgi:hypothetical protein
VRDTGDATEISIEVPDGTSENKVARLVQEGLKSELDEHYSVKRKDGEKIRISRRKKKTPEFRIELRHDVDNIEINLRAK